MAILPASLAHGSSFPAEPDNTKRKTRHRDPFLEAGALDIAIRLERQAYRYPSVGKNSICSSSAWRATTRMSFIGCSVRLGSVLPSHTSRGTWRLKMGLLERKDEQSINRLGDSNREERAGCKEKRRGSYRSEPNPASLPPQALTMCRSQAIKSHDKPLRTHHGSASRHGDRQRKAELRL